MMHDIFPPQQLSLTSSRIFRAGVPGSPECALKSKPAEKDSQSLLD
jgi:hypothetical protein